jgi:hypothetical protein
MKVTEDKSGIFRGDTAGAGSVDELSTQEAGGRTLDGIAAGLGAATRQPAERPSPFP